MLIHMMIILNNRLKKAPLLIILALEIFLLIMISNIIQHYLLKIVFNLMLELYVRSGRYFYVNSPGEDYWYSL